MSQERGTRQPIFEVSKVGKDDEIFLRATNRHIQHSRADMIRWDPLGEKPNAAAGTDALREIEDHHPLLVALVAVDGASTDEAIETVIQEETLQQLSLSRVRRAHSEIA